MTRYVVGVDGGKTKTVALLVCEDGEVVGAGRSGSSDKYDVPLEAAFEAVAASVQEAAQQAGVTLPVDAGCFGLAGADWPEDFDLLEAGLVKKNLAQHVQIKNDMHIALHANTDHGVVVSVGTHTASAIRTPDGEEWHAGWFAGEGPGGVTAGHRALWAVFHAEDGRGEPTILRRLLLQKTGREHPLVLLRELSEGKLDDAFFASLAPLLFEAHYRYGDPAAAKIIVNLGHEVARWVNGLMARYDLLMEKTPVVLSGGLFKGEGTLLLDTVTMAVHTRAPHANIQIAYREPVTGAVIYALEQLGITMNENIRKRIVDTSPPASFFKTA